MSLSPSHSPLYPMSLSPSLFDFFSRLYRLSGPNIFRGEYHDSFALDLACKDNMLGFEMAKATGVRCMRGCERACKDNMLGFEMAKATGVRCMRGCASTCKDNMQGFRLAKATKVKCVHVQRCERVCWDNRFGFEMPKATGSNVCDGVLKSVKITC